MDFRRRVTTTPAVICATVVMTEVAVIGYWITSGATLIVIGLELLVIVTAILVALVVRYRRIGRLLHETTVADAASRERARIAADMHDTLGHQLSLIALRASALQVQLPNSATTLAAEIRRDADEATAHLHDIIEVMQTDGAASIGHLIERARDAGMDVRVRGSVPAVGDAVTVRHLHLVVREGLTNAMRHAPDQPADIAFEADEASDSVSITTALVPGIETASDRQARGVTMLGERIRAAGGTLSVTTGSESFTLAASLPRVVEVAASTVSRPRHPLRVLLAQAAVPLVFAAVVIVGFYIIASRDATMEESAYTAISVGESESSVEPGLPPRQAPIRLIHIDSHPPAWRCDYYTDGNFPLAMATYEICFDHGFVTRTTDLRSRPWT